MNTVLQQKDGLKLLRDGWCDEDVERLTGLSLQNIIELRAEAAAGSSNNAGQQSPNAIRLKPASGRLSRQTSLAERLGRGFS